MTCRELIALVTEYIEGQLPAADRARFDAHLATCADCTVHLDRMRDTIAALGHLPSETISVDARDELLAAFRGWRRG